MKRKMIGLLAAASCMVVAQNASAVDFGIIPRVSVGYENYSVDWSSGPAKMADINVNLVTGTIGATATVDKFYFDVYVMQSLESSDDYTIENFLPVDWDVDVFDSALTAGYNVWKSLAVYAGWKWHKTNMDGTVNTPAGWLGIANLPALSNVLNIDTEFTYNGPFIGISYGWKIGENNLLSVNAAYAWMSGDMDMNMTSQYVNFNEMGMITQFHGGDDGDASGLTLGISWKGYLTDALSYGISADWYKYNFDGFTVNEGVAEQEIDEEAYSFKFTISYDF